MHFHPFSTTFWSLQKMHHVWVSHKRFLNPEICRVAEAGGMHHSCNWTLRGIGTKCRDYLSLPKTDYVYAVPSLVLQSTVFIVSHQGHAGWESSYPEMESNHRPHFSYKAILCLRGWHNRKLLSWKLNARGQILEDEASRRYHSLSLFVLVSLKRTSSFSLPHTEENDACPTFSTCWSH